MNDELCPVCGKGCVPGKPVILAKIIGTEDGGLVRGVPVHVDCLDLKYMVRDNGYLFQILPKEKTA